MNLIDAIADDLDCEIEEAELLATHVIATLEERIPPADAAELESELPSRIRARLAHLDRILDLRGMDDEAFRTRVARRLRMTNEDAERTIAAVLRALSAHLAPRELRRARLPRVAL